MLEWNITQQINQIIFYFPSQISLDWNEGQKILGLVLICCGIRS